jgi:hypothetical protein
MRLKAFLPLVVSATLIFPSLADYPPAPMKQADLLGLWVGYEQGGTDFYRLDLLSKGRGRLVVLRPDGRTSGYRVSWLYVADRLSLEASAIGKAEKIVCAANAIDYTRLRLTMSGASTNEWTRSAVLFNEKLFRTKVKASGKPGE